MRAGSVTVHKGGKEERYKIYVEDYVISYLKFEADTLELSEIFFYGSYEEEKNKITIYGAGKEKNLTIFRKYDFLEKVVCRLTQAGPVFMVREKGELYEVQGYDIFYHENAQMQNYMIECKQQSSIVENSYAHKKEKTQRVMEDKPIPQETEPAARHLHYTLTLQLGVIFVILVAIVINSTNSYDRMEQLNQSAKEVFFALENQEAGDNAELDKEDIELTLENPAKATAAENAGETAAGQLPETTGTLQENVEDVTEVEDSSGAADKEQSRETGEKSEGEEQNPDDAGETVDTSQETEALSRNVVRYYEIERGDTLYAICEEIYGDTSKVQQICDLNQITDPDDIRYGQKIILP